MALAGDHIQVLVGGYELTADSNRISFSDVRDMHDVTAFSDVAHKFISGQVTSKLEHAGYMETAAARSHPVLKGVAVDGVVSTLLGQNAAPVVGNPVYGAVGELLSLINGYNYVGGNPVNRVDPSGMCWVNSSASQNQQSQCSDVWRGYTNLITSTYTQDWPRDVQILVSQEALYWGNLSYGEFVSQWNSSRPPANNDPSGQILGTGLLVAGGVSQADTPLPGPADLLALGIAVCAVGLAALANTGTLTLPLRQTYYFSDSNERANEDEIAWPIPPTRDGAKVVLYRAIDPAELAFVRSVGFTNYGFSPNASGKYFGLTLAGVTRFAGADINSYAIFTLTSIRVSPAIILLGYFFNDVGQQGAGWSIHFSDVALLGLYAHLAASNERIVIIGAV